MKQFLMAFILVVCLLMLSMPGLNKACAVQEIPGRVAVLEEIVTRSETVHHVGRAARRPVIDGKADEWADVAAMVLERQEQGRGVSDANDLSGSLRLLWDEEALYFCLQVTDDVHYAPSPRAAWDNDGMQFVFDAYMNGPGAGYNANHRSFCWSDTADGPVLSMYWNSPDGQRHDVVAGMEMKTSVGADGVRVYEMAMPWSWLAPTHPWVLGRLGFTFSLNDNDGEGFKGARFWTEGLLWGQDPTKFGVLMFDGAMGTRDATLQLAPECNLFGDRAKSRWLELKDVDPFTNARLLVNTKDARRVEPSLTVRRAGESEPLGTARVEPKATGKTMVFAWDLSGLEDGKYELTFEVPGIPPTPHSTWYRLDPAKAPDRIARLTERFGIDRPWDDFAGAPALIQRHRGMVGVVSHWLEMNSTLTGVALDSALGGAVELVGTLEAGEDYLGSQRGTFWSAYYSTFDGSGQPFVAYVPEEYDAGRSWPLIVNLHGRGGRPWPGDPLLQKKRVHLEAHPWGRGDNGYSGIGENDVLEVIAYMKRWYNVDADRVYLSGGSMGGWGAWKMAATYPDMFASVAPTYGSAGGLVLENLRHVPVDNLHGLADWVVPIDGSRYAVNRLQQLGYAVTHHEIPGMGHDPPTEDVWRASWMLGLRRAAQPATVTYTCETPETGRAYWLTVRRFGDPHLRARVKAQVGQSKEYQTLTLLMANVEALELDVTKMPLDAGLPLTVQLGYEILKAEEPLGQKLFIVRKEDTWSVAREWSPAKTAVRPYRPGAAGNLYTGEPLLIVYGTAGGDERTKLLKAGAEKLAAFGGTGGEMAVGVSPIKADTDVTDEDMANFNLVLLGSARDNQLVERMADKLPFTINEKNELLGGDRELVSMVGAGLRMLYYNPLATERLIFLIATDEELDTVAEWLKISWDNNPMTGGSGMNRGDQADLVVQTIGGPVRRQMQLNRQWRWREMAGSDRRLPETMAARREITKAELRVIQRKTGADFAFTWGARADDVLFDPNDITWADVAIERTPRQTLLAKMTGEELIEVYEKWPSEDEICVFPPYDANDIDPQRDYDVVMPPHFCGRLSGRQKNLRDVQAGPDWDVAELWAEVFKR